MLQWPKRNGLICWSWLGSVAQNARIRQCTSQDSWILLSWILKPELMPTPAQKPMNAAWYGGNTNYHHLCKHWILGQRDCKYVILKVSSPIFFPHERETIIQVSRREKSHFTALNIFFWQLIYTPKYELVYYVRACYWPPFEFSTSFRSFSSNNKSLGQKSFFMFYWKKKMKKNFAETVAHFES